MSTKEELNKYLLPALVWLEKKLAEPKISEEEKQKFVLLREFVKEQLPNENSPHTAR